MRKTARPGGGAIAAILAGSWRELPPRKEVSTAEIEAVCPLLLESGAGALAWWRLRNLDPALPFLEELRGSYLSHAVHAVQHEQDVVEVFRVLCQAGIEAILLKGWAVGRLYAEPGLRPPGDIDLCVAPQQKAQAIALLDCEEFLHSDFDLEHDEISRFGGPSVEELLSRSCLAKLSGSEVRVLGAEDHLRILCLHLLKHGAWRPLWLCDIAAALESRPANFNWDRCLGTNERHAQWVLCAVELARDVLGAVADDVPRHETLPAWVLPTVMRQWTQPPPNLPPIGEQIGNFVFHPRKMMQDLRRRWRNPIQATVEADGRFNNWPKFPLQIADGLKRALRLSSRLIRFSQN